MTDDPDRPLDDATVDARLRAAGERLRATAPDPSAGVRSVDRSTAGRSHRRWYAGGLAIGGVAAAAIALVLLPGGTDETLRDVPADQPPDPGPDTTAETPPPTTEPPAEPPTTEPPATELPDSTIQLVEDAEDRGWDGDRGRCYTLEINVPGPPPASSMCLTGAQLDRGVEAYLGGDDYLWRWIGWFTDDGGVASASDGGVGDVVDLDLPASDHAPCGRPEHDLPPDQWVLVSHCTDGAALYTLPPAAPGGPSAVSVGTVLGPEIRLAFVTESIDVEGPRGPERIDLVDVAPVEVGGVTADCVLVVPASATQWLESCRFGDEPAWNGLLVHGSQAFVLEQVDDVRLVPLAAPAVLRTHGCSTPVIDVLEAIADPDGMLAGPGPMITDLACDAAESPFDNPPADQHASATFGATVLRSGPADGGQVVLERADDGSWTITDAGTGIEPEPWPLPIVPAEQFSTDAALLPPVDVTDTLREEVGEAESTDALVQAIAGYLADLHEPEAGDPPVPSLIAGLPTRPAGEGRPAVTAELRYLDDSVSSGIYTIWIADPYLDYPAGIERAYLTNRCSRGVTESDGVLLCI